MEQQQFIVRFPLRYKLLISVVLLSIIVIFFVTVTTLNLFSRDRENYILQGQNTEASIARSAFKGLASRSFNLLTLGLSIDDPAKTQSAVESAIKSQAQDETQTDVLAVSVFKIDPLNGKKKQDLFKVANEPRLQGLQVNSQTLMGNDDLLLPYIEEIKMQGYAFINISDAAAAKKLLAVILADQQNINPELGMTVAMAIISLDHFLTQFQSTRISIITEKSGWIIFDSLAPFHFGDRKVNNDPFYKIINDLSPSMKNLGTGTHRFKSGEEEFLGSYSIFNISPPGQDAEVKAGQSSAIYITARSSWDQVSSVIKDLIAKVIMFSGMAIGAAIIFAILFAKNLTAPLTRLYEATKEVAKGNFNLDLKTPSRDEIGALSTSFNSMSSKISDLIAEQKEKTRLEGELAIATQVQHTLFPPTTFQDDHILIKSHYQSASECGGDWWGFFTHQGKAAFFIADATGHGLPSALITAAARSCFSVIQKICQENPSFMDSPGNMLRFANRAIHEAALGKIMMTFFAGVVDFKKGKMVYASAGHNPPWLFKKTAEGYQMKSLTAKGNRLGEAMDVDKFAERSIDIRAEDILFMYTDGILEGTNAEGQQYGKKQTMLVVESSLKMGPANVVSKLVEEFMKHNGSKPLDDDITLAVAQFK